jgi:polysaccharide export outer membrane protein
MLSLPLQAVGLPATLVTAKQQKDLLGGVAVLKFPGHIAERSIGDEELYLPLTTMTALPKRPQALKFIPSYMFGGRERKTVIGMMVKAVVASWTSTETVYNQGVCVWFGSPSHMTQTSHPRMSSSRLILSALLLSFVTWASQPPQLVPATPPAQARQAPAQSQNGDSQRGERNGGANKPSESPPPLAGSAADSKTYKVGPEDVLYVRVWHEPDFTGPVSVHNDGKFTLPLVGDLQAGGLTPFQIEQNVSTALSKYIVKPLVTVIVQEVRSKRYYLDGEVARPGEYPLVAPTTVLEAISKAGGMGGFANEKKIYILRGSKRIPFNYKEVIRGKNMNQNIQLENDDHIVVP